MKYEEFMKIVDKWSYNDIVCFLMEVDYVWCDGIFAYIKEGWNEHEPIELDEIAIYANDNDIMKYTNLPEEDE